MQSSASSRPTTCASPSSTKSLAALMDELCERKRREFTVESLAEAEPTRAVRAMFRAWGVDPSKYRPSSEAFFAASSRAKDFTASRILSTSATSDRSKPAGRTAATTARASRRPWCSATVHPANPTKASANAPGISRDARFSPTRKVRLAVPSAIPRAA